MLSIHPLCYKIDVFDIKLGLNRSILFDSLLLIFYNRKNVSNVFSTFISNVSIRY